MDWEGVIPMGNIKQSSRNVSDDDTVCLGWGVEVLSGDLEYLCKQPQGGRGVGQRLLVQLSLAQSSTDKRFFLTIPPQQKHKGSL